MIKINVLKAGNGDCIIIKDTKANKNILIDGGVSAVFEGEGPVNPETPLKTAIESIFSNGETIGLLILTHIDCDHIDGLLRWMESREFQNQKSVIEKVWFNSGKIISSDFYPTYGPETGFKEGEQFEQFLVEHNLWDKKVIKQGEVVNIGSMEVTVISPDENSLERLLEKWEEKRPGYFTGSRQKDWHIPLSILMNDEKKYRDRSVPNRSSIACIVKVKQKYLLFPGDAHADVIVDTLSRMGYSSDNKFEAEYVKLSHHGSKGNTSEKLLSMISCKNYIISTDSSTYNHPDKLCLARVIKHHPGAVLHFNYCHVMNNIFSDEDKKFDFTLKEIDGEIKL